MRRVLTLFPAVLLAACADEAPPAGAARDMQEAACTAVIAAHVGRPPAEVTARWLSEENGIARVETLDGDRRHICDVTADGTVVDYIHPLT